MTSRERVSSALQFKEVDRIPIEIGVNAVNAQLFCMPLEELADKYAGRICFWGKDHRLENCEAVYDEWSKV